MPKPKCQICHDHDSNGFLDKDSLRLYGGNKALGLKIRTCDRRKYVNADVRMEVRKRMVKNV
jgi:hypothetical protein